jgi:hypothetical protein
MISSIQRFSILNGNPEWRKFHLELARDERGAALIYSGTGIDKACMALESMESES